MFLYGGKPQLRSSHRALVRSRRYLRSIVGRSTLFSSFVEGAPARQLASMSQSITTSSNRMNKHLSNLFRFYIDLPLLVAFVILIIIFRAALLDDLLLPLAKQLSAATSNSVGATLLLGVLSNVITALLLAALALFFFRLLMRARLSGEYKAFQVDGETTTPYGTVTILFSPLSPDRGGVNVKLKMVHGDMRLEGVGLIVNNRLLIGHYTETGMPERRRCGSFFYQLDGTGQTWQGQFLYISPDTAETVTGTAKWTRA